MRITKALALFGLAIMVVAIPIFSQAPGGGAKPSFEVATIKPNVTGDNRVAIMGQPGGRLVLNGTNLKLMMQFAYAVRDFQIAGGPSWITSDRWDVEARAEEGSIPPPAGPPDPNTPNPMAIRLQSLLEDRFQLKIHRENKRAPSV